MTVWQCKGLETLVTLLCELLSSALPANQQYGLDVKHPVLERRRYWQVRAMLSLSLSLFSPFSERAIWS